MALCNAGRSLQGVSGIARLDSTAAVDSILEAGLCDELILHIFSIV
jgi:hypothetical protein